MTTKKRKTIAEPVSEWRTDEVWTEVVAELGDPALIFSAIDAINNPVKISKEL